MESAQAKKVAQNVSSKPKYPEQHQKLHEMGFDAKSITEALNSTNGDLQAATAVLLGEPAPGVVEVVVATKTVAPMKVVGKQASTAPKVVKVDIKETHNKFMATYKVTKCKDKANHDKRMCFFWHTKGDRRRNPFEILYTCTECPNSTETVNCESGDNCLKAHNMLERMFHPDLFKISMCQRGPNGSHCERGNLCAFAHSDEDHRVPASHTAAKANAANAVAAAASAALASAAAAASVTAANDVISAGKSMTDSRLLDNIQEKLVKLIRSQGTEGIISSELPKRYFDAYAERLELADEAGEKFRIKDLLLSHTNISVTMHKGVQPKYVYEEIEVPVPTPVAAAKPVAATKSPSNPVTAGISYSAIANKGTPKPAGAPLNYAAAAAPVIAATPMAASELAAAAPVVSGTSAIGTAVRKRGPADVDGASLAHTSDSSVPKAPASLVNKMGEIPSQSRVPVDFSGAIFNQWSNGASNASLFDTAQSTGSNSPGSPFLPLGTRRRGPEGGIERQDTATPPTLPSLQPSAAQPPLPYQQQAQLSPGSASAVRLSLSDLSGAMPANSSTTASSPGSVVPPGLPSSMSSNASSPGKHPGAATMVEFHERLSQASNTCEKLSQQVQVLQGELSKRNREAEIQSVQMKGMMAQLSDSTESQNKANSAKDAAMSEVYRVRHELDEMRSQSGDVNLKNREIISKDYTISQLKQERAADLSQFCHSLSQIESALVEMQRKEAAFINEIPLHDTINESSRARDELTKFVGILKMQMNNKIATESANATSSNFLKPVAGNSHNTIGNLGSLLGMGKGESDVFGSPMRPAFSAQSGSFLPSGGFLGGNNAAHSDKGGLHLLGGGSHAPGPLSDDMLLMRDMMVDHSDDPYNLLLSGSGSLGGSKILGGAGNSILGGSSILSVANSGSISGNAGVGSATGSGSSGTMMCALPGCHAEGTFICSACNRSGYCGAQHQR